MKIRLLAPFILVLFIMRPSFSQGETRKELKAAKDAEGQMQVEKLMDSREFVFIPRTVQPQGGRSINLTSATGFVRYHPDSIESDLPYFGRAYSGAGYTGDGGMKFSGRPEDFTIEKK